MSPNEVVHQRGLVATMADGVELVADVWHPAEGGPFPVLLQRLPYGRAVASSPVVPSPTHLARQGFAVVVQDVRGRGDSGGEWVPFIHEATDGAATIEWAAALPFADGRVITYGFSYQGLNQLLAAARRPRGLIGIAPMMCAPDPRRMLYVDDVMLWEATARWAAQLATSERDAERRIADLEAKPLAGAIGAEPPEWYRKWLGPPADDPYWAPLAPDLSAIEVPVFMVLGWADTFATANAQLLRELPGDVVCGPWAHMPWGTTLGSLQLEDAAPAVAIDAFLGFLERLVGGGHVSNPVARYYVVGGGWRHDAAFPPPGEPWVLHATSAGNANSRFGDGMLADELPGADLSDVIVSEPLVPFSGSGTPFPDIRAVEERRDVLCYTSLVVEEPIEFAGSPLVAARVAADGPSFDLVAALVVVAADGKAIRVAHGAIRVQQPVPEDVASVTVELGPIAWSLAAGDALRLDLSATCVPLYAANPQSDAPIGDAVRSDYVVRTVNISAASVELNRMTTP